MATKKVRENNTPVDIEKETYDILKVNSGKEEISIRKKVNSIMKLYLAREKMQKVYFPHLDKIGTRENTIFVHDEKQGKTAHIKIKRGRLICDLENREDCEHVVYCMLCNAGAEILSKAIL